MQANRLRTPPLRRIHPLSSGGGSPSGWSGEGWTSIWAKPASKGKQVMHPKTEHKKLTHHARDNTPSGPNRPLMPTDGSGLAVLLRSFTHRMQQPQGSTHSHVCTSADGLYT
ncbi:uncharacterized protein LOC144113152 [Amblyomma americanum]